MALLWFGKTAFEADLVVFDKDGTLLQFEPLWGRLLTDGVEALTAGAADAEALAVALYEGVGYDWRGGRTRGDGPWAMANSEQCLTILAAVLYQHGRSWLEAERRVRSTWERVYTPEAVAGLTRPTAHLPRLFSALRQAGVLVAVDTADEREATEHTLRELQVDHLVSLLVCGDDDLPPKPAAERLLGTCRQLQVEPSRAVMVGDTIFDLLMAKEAGAGLAVGLLTGPSERETLMAYADVVLDSLAEIGLDQNE